jgi:hypothetical protein
VILPTCPIHVPVFTSLTADRVSLVECLSGNSKGYLASADKAVAERTTQSQNVRPSRHATANRFCHYCAEIHSASLTTTTETPFTTTRSPSSRRARFTAARARHYFRRRTACAVTRSIPYAPLRVRPAITYLTGIEQTIAQACSNANTAHASTTSVGLPSRTLQLSAQRLTRRLRHYGSCGPAGQ